MKKFLFTLSIAGLLAPTAAFAYGEGESIPYIGRAMHLLTNEVRTDVYAAIDACGEYCHEGKHCYKPSYKALYWSDNLFRAAQFHAAMSSSITPPDYGCMQHYSPCQLVDNFAKLFPEHCDGTPKCACKGGVAKCGDDGTGMSTRIDAFGTKALGENIVASYKVDPHTMFYALFNEDSRADEAQKCGFTMNNGHRVNILGGHILIGIGHVNMIAVQDFGHTSFTINEPISAGSHYVDKNDILHFKLHYEDNANAQKAALGIGKSCKRLSLTSGTKTRGVWATTDVKDLKECTPYYYETIAENGTITRFPTTGALLYNCDKSWTSQTDELIDQCISQISDADSDNNNGSDNNGSNNNNDSNNNNSSNNNGSSNNGSNNNNSSNNNGSNDNNGSSNDGSTNDKIRADESDKLTDDSCSATVYRPASSSLWLFLSTIPLSYGLRRARVRQKANK